MKAVALFLLLAPAATALSLKKHDETLHCQVGYSCITGLSIEATRCACRILGHLHEMNTPNEDKLAMLRAIKEKDEGMLVRMRYRQTSRNLLMNMLGSKRDETGTIAEVAPGSCAQAGYTEQGPEKTLPYYQPLAVFYKGENPDQIEYRGAKLEERSPIVHQAVAYGNEIRKDIFLREELGKCIQEGEDIPLDLTFEPNETMDDVEEVIEGLQKMGEEAQQAEEAAQAQKGEEAAQEAQ